jgi:hypothetical protein
LIEIIEHQVVKMAQDRREREFIDEMYKYNEKKEQVLLPKEKILEIIESLQRIETDENYKKSRDDYYYIGR